MILIKTYDVEKRKDGVPSLLLMTVSTASCSQWTISCGGCLPTMEKDETSKA